MKKHDILTVLRVIRNSEKKNNTKYPSFVKLYIYSPIGHKIPELDNHYTKNIKNIKTNISINDIDSLYKMYSDSLFEEGSEKFDDNIGFFEIIETIIYLSNDYEKSITIRKNNIQCQNLDKLDEIYRIIVSVKN